MGRAVGRRRARADRRPRRSPTAASPTATSATSTARSASTRLAGAFAVFGTSFTTAFAFGLAQAAAILGAFYALSRRLLSVVPPFLATAIVAAIGFSGTAFNFVLPHTNSATFGILFLLLTLLALSRERLLLAGAGGRASSA